MKKYSRLFPNLLKSIFSLLCMIVKSYADDADGTVINLSEKPKLDKQPKGFKFLSKLQKEFEEITNFDLFAKNSRVEMALSLVVFYSNEYCLNCSRQEEVITEVYERYRHHVK